MLDPRIYRVAFLPALVAVGALMFSLEPRPEPLAPPASPSIFEGNRAAAATREILSVAPEREPGSAGDAAAADLVGARFRSLKAGQVSEQRFESSFEGEGVDLRNVVLTLPGNSERTIAVVAHRDSASGAGAASSAAATGVLLELAVELAGSRHTNTLMLASTDGGSDGAVGARELAGALPDPGLLAGVVVIAQPGRREPIPPYVVPWSAGPESTSAQLVRTAVAAVREETGRQPGEVGFFGGLFRLAVPSGLGEQAALIEEGFAAVAISAAGERPIDPSEDRPEALSPASLDNFGRAALATVLALDGSFELDHGPDEYVPLSGNLVPGWALRLLALALLLPALAAAADTLIRGARWGQPPLRAVAWGLGRSIPFLVTVMALYLLTLVGLIPSPRFPYDPGRFEPDWRAAVAAVVLAAVLVVSWREVQPTRVPTRPPIPMLAAALGGLSGLAVLGIWFINPYLALLLVPTAHLWTLVAPRRPWRLPAVALATAGSLVPTVVALSYIADRLDLGLGAPWHLLLLLGGGKISTGLALLLSVLAGCTVGTLALSARRGAEIAPET